jgi:hypothetical protein
MQALGLSQNIRAYIGRLLAPGQSRAVRHLQMESLVERWVLTVALLLLGENRQVFSWQLLQLSFEVVMVIRIVHNYLALPHVWQTLVKAA